MIENVNMQPGQHAVFDNFFGSVALLEEFASKKIAATRTLREDSLSGAPLKTRKTLDKMERGTMDEALSSCISVVKWKDNKVVSVAPNKLRSESLKKAKRWNRIQKKYVEVDLPHSINIYNQHMNGVDMFDQQVAAYRCRIRSKKRWWPLFAWTVDAQVVNGWKLFRNYDKKISLLDFARQLVISTLSNYGKPRARPGLVPMAVANTVRYNTQHHWTYKDKSHFNRCRQCGGRTIYFCSVCNIPVHPECMNEFHTKK